MRDFNRTIKVDKDISVESALKSADIKLNPLDKVDPSLKLQLSVPLNNYDY